MVAKMVCNVCNGRGLVAHSQRTLITGVPDTTDSQKEELCSKCGGSGKIPAKTPDLSKEKG